jgi:sugar phosphate isomerase/epimerase
MRLAFSTLGCSGLALRDVAELARISGWTGLELRAAADEPVHTGLTAVQRAAARAELQEIPVLCIASYVQVAAPGDSCVADALAHAQLAVDLGASAVRVFPGAPTPGAPTSGTGAPHSGPGAPHSGPGAPHSGPGATKASDADATAIRHLKSIAARLPDGVEIWLETHDSHPRGTDVARVLGEVGDPRVRAIWDVLHPWRSGEPLTVTAAALHPYLAHVQVKDVASAEERTPVPLGAGSVPLADVLALLRRQDYDGWLSLEWESKWHPAAGPLPEALALSRAYLTGERLREPPGVQSGL